MGHCWRIGGEVAAAVADVELLERELTRQLVRRHLPAIRSARALLLDGNLRSPVIAVRGAHVHIVGAPTLQLCPCARTQPVWCLQEACAAAAGAGVPVFFEPVSAAKAMRAAPSLHSIAFLSPNMAELAALAAEVRKRGRSPPGTPSSSAAAPPGGGAVGQQHAGRMPHVPPAAPADGGQPGRTPAPAQAGERPGSWAWQRGAVPAAECAEVAARLAAAGPDLVAVLAAGAGHVLLTLGALGAVVCRFGASWQLLMIFRFQKLMHSCVAL